jgi:hypothetical protein
MTKTNLLNLVPFINHENFHGSKIVDYFGDKNVNIVNNEVKLERYSPLFICFTNRCGSNVISEDISSIEGFNFYGEILNFDTVIDNSKLHNIDSFYSYFDYIFSQTKNKKPIIKCSYDQIVFLYNQGYLKNYFINSQFILIERKDLVAQAVSHFIALNSLQWASFQEVEIEKIPPLDLCLVLEIINGCSMENSKFKSFFSMCGVNYMQIFYEEYFDKRLFFLNQINKFIGGSDCILELPQNIFEKQVLVEKNVLRDNFVKIYSALISTEKINPSPQNI